LYKYGLGVHDDLPHFRGTDNEEPIFSPQV